MRRIALFSLAVTALINCAGLSYAEEEAPRSQLRVEMQIYQVLTNLTGNGQSSRTLPGDEGSYQILHVKLDDVALDMEGRTLTWDGEPFPSHHAIRNLARPSMILFEGQEVGMHVRANEPVEYLDRREDGLFELKTLDTEESNRLGIATSLTVRRSMQRSTEPVLEIDMTLSYRWIGGRERIEGVDLNIGKPVLSTKTLDCFFGARPDEWVCYRTAIRSQGYIYLFMRVIDVKIPGSGKD